MKKTGISPLSRVLSALAGIALVISLFVPMWRIELDAPQYPEGLALQIFPHKLGGDVDIINGLNHYIGMQTLHAENFVEFTVLPYIIAAFALAALLAAAIGNRKLLQIVFFAFVIFGLISTFAITSHDVITLLTAVITLSNDDSHAVQLPFSHSLAAFSLLHS